MTNPVRFNAPVEFESEIIMGDGDVQISSSGSDLHINGQKVITYAPDAVIDCGELPTEGGN